MRRQPGSSNCLCVVLSRRASSKLVAFAMLIIEICDRRGSLSVFLAVEKVRIVLSVLVDEITVAVAERPQPAITRPDAPRSDTNAPLATIHGV